MKQFYTPSILLLLMARTCLSVSLGTGPSRRMVLGQATIAFCTYLVPRTAWPSSLPSTLENFRYSETWFGTALPLLDVERASQLASWDMGRWPDPILRRPAAIVEDYWFGTQTLKRVSELLAETAQINKAVGLAAQQCGVNARIVYIEEPKRISMVNPQIVGRSEERFMKIWQEFCLVLPPTFIATVLRDAWVDVEYWDWEGHPNHIRLKGEAARAAQHELDHDRGILTLDHVALEEMENDVMRSIEKDGHDERMGLAYSRYVTEGNSMANH
jgi:peptide deformylase